MIRKITTCLSLSIALFVTGILAQDTAKDTEHLYLLHQYHNNEYEEVVQWATELSSSNYTFSDSTLLIISKAAYYKKDYEKSLSWIDQKENMTSEDRYFVILNYVMLDEYTMAGRLLQKQNNFPHNSTTQMIFEQTLQMLTSGKNKDLALQKIQPELPSEYDKSPVLAAAFSTLLPGLGKVYAGFPRDALSNISFLAYLGILAGEGYYKDGIKSPHFLVFSSLFTIFYGGQIVGSYRKVTSEKQYAKHENDLHLKHALSEFFMAEY